MLKNLVYILLLVVTLALCSCNNSSKGVDDAVPSVYYWRTVFSLDSVESDFLKKYDVGRMYVRYFDVVVRDGKVMPNATIKFEQPMPAGIEVVPTVFIMENCLSRGMDGIAGQLVDRILQMNETHDITGVKEIQIDCDWTIRSQEKYYAFLNEVGAVLKEHGMRLSATIRLHQLSLTPPPVDYGVLMMYNTGALGEKTDRNPILDYRDVYPYLKHLRRYDLPLCAAWPTYEWNLLYDNKQFKAIVYSANVSDTTIYHKGSTPGRYMVISDRVMPEPNSDGSDRVMFHVGDSLIVVRPTAEQIMHIVEATEKERPSLNKQVVIYSLDTKNIENYDNEFFKAIFNR